MADAARPLQDLHESQGECCSVQVGVIGECNRDGTRQV